MQTIISKNWGENLFQMLTIPSANLCTLIVANLIQDLDSDFTYHVIDECNGDDIQIARRLAKESRVQMAKLDGFLMANAQWEVLDFIDKDDKEVTKQMAKFNTHVRLRPYIEGHRLSFSDIHQFVLLGASVNYDPTKILGGQQAFAHVTRWFLNLKNMPVITRSIAMASVKTLTVKERVDCSTTLDKLEAAFASKLPNAVMGKVKTRFAPEPSGYLHLGHTKAALINMFFARYFGGEMIVRFDDTNPTKEKAEFENSIIEDLRTLGIEVPTVSYTSDEFPRLEKAMEDMIRQGKAYIDTTPVELMRAERFDGIASACRDVSVELNLKRWADMLAGNEEGQKCCVRVKIDMQSKNKCMRDPVAYRVNVTDTHHKTGNSYKAYPTYDFACPLVDSWTGITHALRSNEYADRIPQYYWFQDAMKIPRTTVYEFSRLNLSNTVLSKRKLNWLVNTGKVDGWEDPRLPTVRGLIRRGLTVQAIYEFLMEQGPSKNANLMEWDKLWSKNAKVLDPISPRFMAINAQYASLEITNFQDDRLPRERLLFPKDKSKGTVPIIMQPVVALEREDASACELDEMVTLWLIKKLLSDHFDADW